MSVVPLFPSLVAVIVARPTATASTSPVGDTVTLELSLLDHVTVFPVKAAPLLPKTATPSFAVPVGFKRTESLGLIVTVATVAVGGCVGPSVDPPAPHEDTRAETRTTAAAAMRVC